MEGNLNDRSKNKFPESFEGKTVLVAGAAGFIPSHLCEFYLKKGAKVIGLDNFITGSESNIELLSKYENFEFHKCNVIDGLPKLDGKIDYVFSLASPASPIDFKVIPLEIMRVNADGTRNLLELTKEKGARFLEASTSEVYGDPLEHPQVETYFGNVNPIGPRSCYDESKRYAEALTMAFNKKYNVDTRIVRIFNTYGPRMRPDDGRVIPNFVNQAIKNEPLTVYGDGTQTRSFCFVSDLVTAMNLVMHSNDHTPFNIGNPLEYSVLDCAKEVIKALDSKSEIKFFNDMRMKDDPCKRRPNLSKIQAVSDYDPKVSFESGIKETAEFFKSIL